MGTATPKIMAYKDGTRRVLSIRSIIDLDYVSEKGFVIIQWGKEPVKFFCYLKSGGRVPVFLYSVRWLIKLSFWKFRAGYTCKPINLSTFWRNKCSNAADLNLCRHTTISTNKTSSKIGLPTPAQE